MLRSLSASRPRLFYVLSASFSLASILAYFLIQDISLAVPVHYLPSFLSPPSKVQLGAVFEGEWMQKEPRPTPEQLNSMFELSSGCFARRPEHFVGNWTTDYAGPKSLAGMERMHELLSYEWVPKEGGLREWDGEAFIMRLLQSRIGLVLVGDSLTAQALDTLVSIFGFAHPTSPEDTTPRLLQYMHPISRAHIALQLNRQHPLYIRLASLEETSKPNAIPLARLSEPVMTLLRADHLLPYSVITKLVEEKLGIEGWSITKGNKLLSGEDWIKWLGDRLAFNSEVLMKTGEVEMIESGSESGWLGEQDGFLVLSTGPHWSAVELAMELDSQVDTLYRALAQATLAWLPKIPLMKTLYRATSPAHVNCSSYTEPFTSAQVADKEDLGRVSLVAGWRWDQFPVYNDVWRNLILGGSAPDGVYGRDSNYRVGYLDVWKASVMRGDAHALGPSGTGDCLHFCLPSVPWLWVQMIWHVML